MQRASLGETRVKRSGLPARIASSHARLSKWNLDLTEWLCADPDALTPERFERASLPSFAQRYDYQLQRWPILVSAEFIEGLARAASQAVQLLRAVPQTWLQREAARVHEFFGIDPAVAARCLQVPWLNDIAICRCDFVESPAGWQLLELNGHGAIGGWQIYLFEECYRRDRPLSHFCGRAGVVTRTRNPFLLQLRHVADVARDVVARDSSSINVGLVLPKRFVPDVEELLQRTRRENREAGVDISFAICTHLDEIEFHARDVFVRGHAVHALIDHTFGTDHPQALYDALAARRVVVFNSQLAVALGNKRALALLSEMADEGRPDATWAERVRALIPWTRRVQDIKVIRAGIAEPLEVTLRRDRASLVLKPEDGAQGVGVTIGRYASEREWMACIERAMASGTWIVQEYRESPPFIAQYTEFGACAHHFVWGAFVYGASYAGSWVRMLPVGHGQGIINSKLGAAEGIVFEHP